MRNCTDRLNKTTTEYGMKINTKKTKVMKISRVEEEERSDFRTPRHFVYEMPQRNQERGSDGKRII